MHWDVLLVTMRTRDKALIDEAIEDLTQLVGTTSTTDKRWPVRRLQQWAEERFGDLTVVRDSDPGHQRTPPPAAAAGAGAPLTVLFCSTQCNLVQLVLCNLSDVVRYVLCSRQLGSKRRVNTSAGALWAAELGLNGPSYCGGPCSVLRLVLCQICARQHSGKVRTFPSFVVRQPLLLHG